MMDAFSHCSRLERNIQRPATVWLLTSLGIFVGTHMAMAIHITAEANVRIAGPKW